MTEELIRLEIIDDNPFQDRGSYEDIAELGRTIAVNGLEQKPKARLVGQRYQLKFGHRRKRAFDWLQDNFKVESLPDRYSGYTVMPLDVEEITDKEMFDGVVIENVHRDDLKVTEKARLLRRYKEVNPDATSEKIGLVFNMNAATVRGMDIFLDLPEVVQTKLDDGTITMSTARLLHSMKKVAPEAKIVETLKKIEKEAGEQLPEDVIDSAIDRLDNTVDMWNGNHSEGNPRGGYHGWPLDMKNLPARLLPGMSEKTVGAYEVHLDHLMNPPACTACPFYTKVRGSHYCGMKVCFERKTVAWGDYAVEAANRSTKVAVYAESDGPYRALESHNDKSLFEKKHKDLRLLPKRLLKGYAFQSFKGLDDDLVVVVATGEALNKITRSSGKTQGGKKTEKEKAEMRAMRRYRQVRRELVWEYTAAAQSLFEGLPIEVLRKIRTWHFVGIDDSIPEEYRHPDTGTAAEKLEYARRDLVWALIVGETSHYSRDELTGYLAKFAEITNVKAPKQLMKRAEEWDAEIHELASVSVETAKKKK